MGNRLKVLLSAYACEPGRGSEPEVGWRVATQMAKHCDVWVITRVNNREVIERGLESLEGPKPEFLYFDFPRWVLRLKRWPGGVVWYYLFWQVADRFWFRRELAEVDLVHHVTFNGVQFPGFWVGTDTPVLLGPLGGGMTCPPALLPMLGCRQFAEKFRNLVIRLLPILPWWKPVLVNASMVIAANRETAALLQPHCAEAVPIMLETAIMPEAVLEDERSRPRRGRMTLLWLGNLIPRKAPILAVRAVARAIEAGAEVELLIAGDGVERAHLVAAVKELKLEERVTLLGKIPKAEVPELMDRADAFLFTSVRDTSGNVILEAMSRGLPVIALNHQGVREICDQESALLVEVKSVEGTEKGLAEAICQLEANEDLAEKIGVSARKRLKTMHTWERLSERLLGYYQSLAAASRR